MNDISPVSPITPIHDDEDVCRVCRGPSQIDQPLFHPCRCSGSMKFVHQDCLEQWLRHSGKNHCEICGYKFDFSPIYAHEHGPPSLTVSMIVKALIKKTFSWNNPLIRIPLAFFAWLVALPWCVLWVWRAIFDMPGVIKAFAHSGFSTILFGRGDIVIPDDISHLHASTLPSIHMERIGWKKFWLVFLPDVLQGHVIALACICLGLMMLCLKEYVVMHTPLDGNGRLIVPEVIPEVVEPQVVEQPPPQESSSESEESEESDESDETVDSDQEDVFPRLRTRQDHDSYRQSLQNDVERRERHEIMRERARELYRRRARTDTDSENDSDNDSDIQRPERNDEDPAQQRAARLAQLMQGLDDLPDRVRGRLEDLGEEEMRQRAREIIQVMRAREGQQVPQPPIVPPPVIPPPVIPPEPEERDFLPILQLLGINGPPEYLIFHPAFTFSMISIIIFFVAWWPHLLGRWVLMVASVLTPLFKQVEKSFVDPLAKRVAEWLLLVLGKETTETMEKPIEVIANIVQNITSTTSETTISNSTISNSTISNSTISTNQTITFYPVYDHTDPDSITSRAPQIAKQISLGWMLIISFLIAHAHVYKWHKHPYMVTLARLIKGGFTWCFQALKFIVFLSIELLCFPLMCGVLMHLSLLPWTPLTFETFVTYHQQNPWTTRFLIWLSGTLFMFGFATLVSTIKTHVRPGVMYFLRDPNDPEFAPMRDIIENGWWEQMRKLGLSAFMYASMVSSVFGGITLLILAFDYTIEALLQHMTGYNLKMLPLRLQAGNYLENLPLDYLVLYFGIPHLISHFDVLNRLDRGIKSWLVNESRRLRISEYMFGTKRVQEHDSTDGWMRVPNRDFINIKRGEVVLVPWKEHEPLTGRPGETPDQVRLNWKLVRVPERFKKRLMRVVFDLWLTIVLLTTMILVLPITLGRILASRPDLHDVHAHLLGTVVIGYTAYFIDLAKARQLIPRHLLRSLGFLTTLTILPLLMGYIVDFYAVKLFSKHTSHVWEIWSMGLLGLRIVWNLVDLTNSSYKQEMDRFRRDGWDDSMWYTMVWCVFWKLGLALLIPFGLVQVLPKGDEDVELWKNRIVFTSTLILVSCHLIGQLIGNRLKNWLDRVRDEQFLVGRRLHNYET